MKADALAQLLASRIYSHHFAQNQNRRTLISLAGGPGSGKTFIASAIASAVTQKGLKAQAVSVEGFVKPSHALTQEQVQNKGSIDTFDGHAVVEFLQKLRELGPGHELSCPGHDEDWKFEPIPDGERIEADTQVVIFEGIYTLSNVEPWTQICAPLVDERWFIDVKPELVRQRVAERRLSRGKASSMEESLRTYDEFDSGNTKWIAENVVVDVDVTIRSDEECSVIWPDGREEK